MIGVVHLRPHPASHAAPSASATLLSSKLLSNSGIKSCFRPSPVLKMGTTTRRLRLASRCAADRPCEPSPDEDSSDALYRRHREKMDKFEKELRAELRARRGQDDMVIDELEATLFHDERDKVQSYVKNIVCNSCILYKESRKMAFVVALNVQMAMELSTMITANAHLRADGSSGILFSTVEQIIRTYVPTFLKFLEDTWHRKIDKADSETRILSFLGALSGLAAVSHIMFEDALVTANNSSDETSSHYRPEFDVETLNYELKSKMRELKRKFVVASKTSDDKAYKLLPRTLDDATKCVTLFVIQMIYLRKKALAHARARANDGEHGGSRSTA